MSAEGRAPAARDRPTPIRSWSPPGPPCEGDRPGAPTKAASLSMRFSGAQTSPRTVLDRSERPSASPGPRPLLAVRREPRLASKVGGGCPSMTSSTMDDDARPVRRRRSTVLYVAATVIAVGALGAASPPIAGDPGSRAVAARRRGRGDAWTGCRRGPVARTGQASPRVRLPAAPRPDRATARCPGRPARAGPRDRGQQLTGREDYWFAARGAHARHRRVRSDHPRRQLDGFIGGPGAILNGLRPQPLRVSPRTGPQDVRISPTSPSATSGGGRRTTTSRAWSTTTPVTTGSSSAQHRHRQRRRRSLRRRGDGNVVRWNCLKDNGQYGFSVYEEDGVVNVTIDHNEVTGNNKDDWESRIDGCGCSGGAKFWEVNRRPGHQQLGPRQQRARSVGRLQQPCGFLVRGQLFRGEPGRGALFYEVSYNTTIRYNTLKRNTIRKGRVLRGQRRHLPGGGGLHLRGRWGHAGGGGCRRRSTSTATCSRTTGPG